MEYQGRNVCPRCKRAYVKWIDVCPKCKIQIKDTNTFSKTYNHIESEYPFVRKYSINRLGIVDDYKVEQIEGEGRKYGVGGAACDICPHCYGNKDWCPIMD